MATDSAVATPTPGAGGERTRVEVMLTRVGAIDGVFAAAAFVQGGAESGGACTLTLTRGETVVQRTAAGLPSATTTVCAEGLETPVAELGAGTWTVSIAYDSAGYAGASDDQEVEIP